MSEVRDVYGNPVSITVGQTVLRALSPSYDKSLAELRAENDALRKENEDLRDRLAFVSQGKQIHETAYRYWKLTR